MGSQATVLSTTPSSSCRQLCPDTLRRGQELLLAADASPYGVGAVLSHRFANGSERPIAYASRSLSPAERRYSQLDKEALAIIFPSLNFDSTCWDVIPDFVRS